MGATPVGVKLWPGGIVPYEINADLGNIVAIKDAIKTVEQQTNVRMVGRYLQNDYVRFSKQTLGTPNSRLGRKGGRQYLNASLNDVGSIVHEICHALGMMHEHQRQDRDNFIIFHADRVTQDMDQYERRGRALRPPVQGKESPDAA